MSKRPDVRLAADIGGTFTDIVLDRGTERLTRKVLTTAKRPEEGVLEGTRLVLGDAGLHFSDIDVFIHGTTLATNAIIERRGARTALIATDGFRDVLDIATESRYDQYDLTIEKPQPLVPRALALHGAGARRHPRQGAARARRGRGHAARGRPEGQRHRGGRDLLHAFLRQSGA